MSNLFFDNLRASPFRPPTASDFNKLAISADSVYARRNDLGAMAYRIGTFALGGGLTTSIEWQLSSYIASDDEGRQSFDSGDPEKLFVIDEVKFAKCEFNLNLTTFAQREITLNIVHVKEAGGTDVWSENYGEGVASWDSSMGVQAMQVVTPTIPVEPGDYFRATVFLNSDGSGSGGTTLDEESSYFSIEYFY